jgi:hypothetical protein
MDVVRFELPNHCVNSYARYHFSTKADYVLVEDVHEWLEEHQVSYTIRMHKDYIEEDIWDHRFQYDILFDDPVKAVLFKLRWH